MDGRSRGMAGCFAAAGIAGAAPRDGAGLDGALGGALGALGGDDVGAAVTGPRGTCAVGDGGALATLGALGMAGLAPDDAAGGVAGRAGAGGRAGTREGAAALARDFSGDGLEPMAGGTAPAGCSVPGRDRGLAADAGGPAGSRPFCEPEGLR